MHKITVHFTLQFKKTDLSLPALETLVRNVCTQFGILNAMVDIAVVDDAHIRRMNRKFLKRNCSTDCLSFDLSDDKTSPRSFELVVNAQRAVRQAKKRGHSQQAELALYITHGLLHNLGFDDSSCELADKMHRMEDEILQQQGFGQVYNT